MEFTLFSAHTIGIIFEYTTLIKALAHMKQAFLSQQLFLCLTLNLKYFKWVYKSADLDWDTKSEKKRVL